MQCKGQKRERKFDVGHLTVARTTIIPAGLVGFILIVGAILTGCSPKEVTATTEKILQPSPSPTITSGNKIIPSPTHVPTTTPTLQITTTPISTLVPQDQDAYLLNLIETNGGCRFPCIMGIEPGLSSWESLRKIFDPISSTKKGPNEWTWNINGNEDLIGNMFFRGSEKIINHIQVEYHFEPYGPSIHSSEFGPAIERYSIQKILAEYGVPSRILLFPQEQLEELGPGPSLEIVLFYDKLGFVVHYGFENVLTVLSPSVYYVCPDFESTDLFRLFFQASDDPAPLERMFEKESNDWLTIYLQPVEKVTNLSVEDFYNLFVTSGGKKCFEIEYWRKWVGHRFYAQFQSLSN
jgi:hypothetical protein